MAAQYQISGRTGATIADSLERGVDSGALAPSELLPPIRDLAGILGVSAGTVAAGYRLARQRGLTVSDRRRGTRIRPWSRLSEPAAGALGPRRQHAGAAGSARSGVIDVSSGSPDPILLPDLTEILRRLDYRPATYGTPVLDPALRLVAEQALGRDGLPVDHLTCTFGALDGIGRILNSALRPGDRVAVEDPGWPALINGLGQWGLIAVPVRLDDLGAVPEALWDALAGGARAAVLTSRAQNPTGAAITADRARALADVLGRYPGVLTIEDDHGHGITDAGLQPIASAGPSLPGPWAFVRSAAKAFGPDLRLAVVTGDMTTVRRIDASLDAGAGWVSHLLQQVVAEVWSDSAVAAITKAAAAAYDGRRRSLLGHLEAAGMKALGRTGLNVWIPVDDEASCVAKLWAGGWVVQGGRAFRLASEPGIRVTTASLPSDRAGELAGLLTEVLGTGTGRY